MVVTNATLTLSGDGEIKATTKNPSAAITAQGSDTVININGVTIDTAGEGSTIGNYAYGIYLKNGSTVNFNSGTIKVGQGSCISSNNTTGGCDINVNGGELLSDGGYAIYVPAQGRVNISGGTVQGINARMGNIQISGSARIIPTTITEETCEDLGHNFNASGSIGFGDTIALVVGTYSDPSGTELVLDIKDNATVESNFRSAIAVYDIDTKQAQEVHVTIADSTKVKTTDTEYSDVQVYDHDAVASAASEAGKSYEAVADSVITIESDGQIIYPVVDENN